MDPDATLDRARDLFYDELYLEAHEVLMEYLDWRAAGGFEPPSGDARARTLARDLTKHL